VNRVPIDGISLRSFIGGRRGRLRAREGPLFASVFRGSGLLFRVMPGDERRRPGGTPPPAA
jgi:hypothetical protein